MTSVNYKCRAFTSLEQSRKLAEILPLESADLSYMSFDNHITLCSYIKMINDGFNKDEVIPCWSLAALLGVLPEPYQLTSNKEGKVQLMLIHQLEKDYYDNPVDACVSMVEKLHELNLL